MNTKNGSLKIYKVDKDNEKVVLGSVKFELYNEKNEKIGTYITNENGEIDIPNLRIGKYKIKEINTNKWYNLAKETNIEVNWNECADVVIENELKKGQVKVTKVDSENNEIKIEDVEFEVLDENGQLLEKIKTDKKGEALTSKYVLRDYPVIYLKEVSTNDKYILNDEKIKVELKENTINELTLQNTKIKGQIRVIKTSSNDSKVLGIKKGTPIEGVKFEVYDKNNNFIELIKTNNNGIAITSELEKGEYKLKEIETNKWYYLNNKDYNVSIQNNNEIVDLKITNEPKNPEVKTEKIGQDRVEVGKNIDYDISIKNDGNTDLDKLYWIDEIPIDYIKILKIKTGTYNQKVNYNVLYKTNLSHGEYILLMEDLNSQENYEINFNKELADNEYVTEIKIEFNKVDIGFSSNENLHLSAKTNNNLKSETTFINTARLFGEYQGNIIENKSSWKTMVYKLLPKTGF